MAVNATPKNTPGTQPRKRGQGWVYRRKNSVNWWIAFYRRGKLHRETSHSTDQAIAEKKLDKRVRQVSNEREGIAAFVPKAEKVYVDELLDELEKDYKLNGGRGLPEFQSHLKLIR